MEIKLTAQLRDLKTKLGPDYLPAVIYGGGLPNKNLQVKRIDLEKAFALAGESNLISLEVAGEPAVKVLVKEAQYDHLRDTLRHIDFYQVKMDQKINTEIPLHFIGESKAIKELGGMLERNLSSLEVECLPGDLVDHIDVDISAITDFHQPIRISDLAINPRVKIMADPQDIVAIVVEPKVEVEAPVAPVVAEATAEDKTAPADEEDKDKKEKDKGKEAK